MSHIDIITLITAFAALVTVLITAWELRQTVLTLQETRRFTSRSLSPSDGATY